MAFIDKKVIELSFYFVSYSQWNFIIKELSSGIKPRQQAIQGVKTIYNQISKTKEKLKDIDQNKLFTLTQEAIERRSGWEDKFIPDEKFLEIIITIIIEHSKSLKD